MRPAPLSLRILLVEDEPDACRALAEILTEVGHTVTAVGDGAAALEEVSRTVFDVVITDVNLPKVDGMTLFRRICAKSSVDAHHSDNGLRRIARRSPRCTRGPTTTSPSRSTPTS